MLHLDITTDRKKTAPLRIAQPDQTVAIRLYKPQSHVIHTYIHSFIHSFIHIRLFTRNVRMHSHIICDTQRWKQCEMRQNNIEYK